MVRYRAAGRS